MLVFASELPSPFRHLFSVMAIHDVISELNRIQSEGLISAYAIGGAVAAQAYIEASDTEDVDVFVVIAGDEDASLNPHAKVSANLIQHGAKWSGPYLLIGGWPVQLLPPASKLYEDAITTARAKDFGNQIVGRILGPEHLATIALATGRSKDYIRVDEFIKRGKVDLPALMAMIDQYGLKERWDTFRKLFIS